MTTYLEAIREAMWEEMEADPDVFLMGEDVGRYGGAFRMTEGFLEKFGPSRVIDTPITESAIVGAAIGCSQLGLKPICEMQFMDFVSSAFNMIVNFAAKVRYRTGRGAGIVIRGPCGAGSRAGPFHSQNVESYFANVPGLKLVAPATVRDAKGLLKAAVRDPDPVLYLEHKFLYRRLKEDLTGFGDQEDVPLGTGRIHRPGSDLTIVAYGSMVHTVAAASEALSAEDGAEAEIIDLRTHQPLDFSIVEASVRRTNRLLVAHEAPVFGGFGGELIAQVTQRCFEWLDAPPVRVAALDTPVPYAASLEDAHLPGSQDVLGAARKLMAY